MSGMIRVEITADDGHSCTILTTWTATVQKVTEDYSKLRNVSDPLGSPVVDAAECVLAYSTPVPVGTEAVLEYLNPHVRLSAVLDKSDKSKKSHGTEDIVGRFRLFGLHGKKNSAAFHKFQSLAGQLSSLSSAFAKTMSEFEGEGNVSTIDLLSLRVNERVQAFKNEVQLILAGGKPSDRVVLDAAQGMLSW